MAFVSALRGVRDIAYSNLFVTLPYPTSERDLSEETIIVTGSNGGLGYEASQHLLRLGVGKLIMAVRDVAKGDAAKQDLVAATGRPSESIEVWQLDMSSYGSVTEFSKKAVEKLPRLDAVLANAAQCTHSFSLAEGSERSITVNVISQSLLLLLLLPKLREAPSGGRFSLVSSKVHYIADMNQLGSQSEPFEPMLDRLSDQKMADMNNRYFLSKLLALYATREFAKAISASEKGDIVLNAPNPGYCRTNLERDAGTALVKIKYAILHARMPEMGSRPLVHGVLAGPETHGCFLNDCHVEEPGPTVTSQRAQKVQKAFYSELLDKLEAISPGVTANI